MEPRKRSSIVALTLVGLPLGAIGIVEAFPAQQMQRNLYPDRGACERDYSPQQCAPHAAGGGAYGGGWHGPYYVSDRNSAAARGDPGIGRTGQITRTEISVRGGFGSIGRSLRAVG